MKGRIRYTSPLLALAVMATMGCTENDPVAVEHQLAGPEVVQTASSVATSRPVIQKSSGILYPIGSCEDGVVFAVEGSGTCTHLGRFDASFTFCFNLATGAVTDGQGVFVAANGDEIYPLFSGQSLGPGQVILWYTINGGTGRFEHAQGEMTGPVTTLPDGTWTHTAEGWISYDASDRSNN